MISIELGPLAQNLKMLAKWDNDELIQSMLMGGLGDSYEMPIHRLAVESLRLAIDDGLPDLENSSPAVVGEWAEYFVGRVFKKFEGSGLFSGMSGGQVGVSMQILFMSALSGWFSMVETMPKDRLICVSKDGRIVSGKL